MLLSLKKRKEYFKALNLGEYNKTNILKLQKKYFVRKSDHDGIYGKNTDILLRHIWNCSQVRNFEPEEFKCECGGKYCTGYPDRMKMIQLNLLQEVRNHYNKTMHITSGLRCKKYNSEVGGIKTSKHLSGYATDFYMSNITDTLTNRRITISYLKTLDNFVYAYGDGIDSNNNRDRYPKMGTSIHVQTK